MRLVAIQMTDDALFAINDLHLLAFRQPDALLYTKGTFCALSHVPKQKIPLKSLELSV